MKRILCCMALALLLTCSAFGQFILVDKHAPQAVVVTADNPVQVATYAAQELVWHIEQATGVRLAVVTESTIPAQPAGRIYMGATQAARQAGIDPDELPAEVALLRTAANALYIVGRDAPGNPLSMAHPWSGTLWGVYELLEREAGVRWLWPGELGTYVPKTERLLIRKLDERLTPPFARRALRQYGRGNDPRFGFSAEGQRRYTEAETVFLRRHRMGRSEDPRPYTGHSFTSWWKQYGAQHPEWFQQQPDGRRGPSSPEGQRVTMCVSNPELVQEIVRRFAEQRKQRPEQPPVLAIGESDMHTVCLCDACKAWDDPAPTAAELAKMPRYARSLYHPNNSGARYARFWQAVYDEACKVEPKVIVTALIYSYYSVAPQAKIKLNPNIVLAVCVYSPHTPIPGPDEPMTPTVYTPMAGGQRNWWYPRHPDEQRWINEQWERWRATGATLYWRPNFLLDGYAMPHLYAHQLGEEFRHHAAQGMLGTDFDALLGQWATQGPTLYLLARWHTHPTANVDDLLAEYYRAFGPAAPHVRDYFAYWERHTTSTLARMESLLIRYGVAQAHTYPRMAHEMFPPTAFREAEVILARAEAAAANEPTSRDRVAFLRNGFTHAQLCVQAATLFADANTAPEQRRAAMEELAAFRRSVEGSFIANFAPLCYQETRSWGQMPGFAFPPVE